MIALNPTLNKISILVVIAHHPLTLPLTTTISSKMSGSIGTLWTTEQQPQGKYVSSLAQYRKVRRSSLVHSM